MQSAAAKHQTHDLIGHLKALNARFIHNFVTNDVASHDALLHRDFISINAKGGRESRADYLKGWATGFDPEVLVYWDTRDESITVVGNIALVRATNKHVVRQQGKEVTGMTTYTDTYVFENNEWRCVQAHLTHVAPECEPGDSTIVSVYLKGQLQESPL